MIDDEVGIASSTVELDGEALEVTGPTLVTERILDPGSHTLDGSIRRGLPWREGRGVVRGGP